MKEKKQVAIRRSKKPIEIVLLLFALIILGISSLLFLLWLQPVVYSISEPIGLLRTSVFITVSLCLVIIYGILKRQKWGWYLCVIFTILKILPSIKQFFYFIFLSQPYEFGYYLKENIITLISIFVLVLLFRRKVLFYFKLSFRRKIYKFYKYIRKKSRLLLSVSLAEVIISTRLIAKLLTLTSYINSNSQEYGSYTRVIMTYSVEILCLVICLISLIGIGLNKKWGYTGSFIFFMILSIYKLIDFIYIYTTIFFNYFIMMEFVIYFSLMLIIYFKLLKVNKI